MSKFLPPLSNKHCWVFDPGETTGFVCVAQGNIQIHLSIPEIQLRSYAAGFTSAIPALSDPIQPQIFIVERFSVYREKANMLTNNTLIPVQVIGMIKVLALRMGLEIVEQTAQNMKQYATKEKLIQYRWWNNLTKHEHDAAGHALLYLTKEYIKEDK